MTAAARKAPLRAADDKPFDFNLNAVEAEVDLRPWRVIYGPKDRRWTFQHPEAIDVWGVLAEDEAGSRTETEVNLSIFKLALGDEQFAEFQKIPLPAYKLKALMKAYQEHGGAEPGESDGSTAS